MFGMLFAIFCAVMLIRLWVGPRRGPWAYGGCGHHGGWGPDRRAGGRADATPAPGSTGTSA